MNYNSKIKLRDEFGRHDCELPKMRERAPTILKYWRGYFGIRSKTKAREFLNKQDESQAKEKDNNTNREQGATGN